MSVINKMLNDLEKRTDDQGLEGYDGKYTPTQSNNKYKIIIASLVAVSISLAALLSWLVLMDDSDELVKTLPLAPQKTAEQTDETEQSSVKEQADGQAETKQKPATIKPLVKAKDKSQDTKKPTVQPKPSIKEQNKVDPIKAAERLIAEEKQKAQQAKAKAKTPKPQPKVVTPPKQQAPTLKIEKTATKLTPEQKVARLMKDAKANFEKGMITDALENLNKVLRIDDGHVEARELMAVAWYGRGDIKRAVAIINDGLNRYPNVDKWRIAAAKMFYKDNDKSGALSYLSADLTSANEEYYSLKANIARELQNWPLAESAYTMLTRKQPQNGNWWVGQAIALDAQQKYDRAILSYQTALTKGQFSQSTRNFVENRLQELQQ